MWNAIVSNINNGKRDTRTIISIAIDIQNIELTQSCIEYGDERARYFPLLAKVLYIFNKFICIIFNNYIYMLYIIYIK